MYKRVQHISHTILNCARLWWHLVTPNPLGKPHKSMKIQPLCGTEFWESVGLKRSCSVYFFLQWASWQPLQTSKFLRTHRSGPVLGGCCCLSDINNGAQTKKGLNIVALWDVYFGKNTSKKYKESWLLVKLYVPRHTPNMYIKPRAQPSQNKPM